jgi:hypothetical protein
VAACNLPSSSAAAEGDDSDDEKRSTDSAGPCALPSKAAAATASNATILGISTPVLYSLQYHQDLLEPITPQDAQEMQQQVLEALVKVTGVADGWRMQVVGGGRRSQARHDADYLISHPSVSMEGLVTQVYDHLVWARRLVPQHQGFCRMQQGRMPGYKEKLRKDLTLQK